MEQTVEDAIKNVSREASILNGLIRSMDVATRTRNREKDCNQVVDFALLHSDHGSFGFMPRRDGVAYGHFRYGPAKQSSFLIKDNFPLFEEGKTGSYCHVPFLKKTTPRTNLTDGRGMTR